MHKNLLLITGVALLAGFLGGAISSWRVEAASSQVVRASRFELVNTVGAVVATWSVESENEVHFRFMRGPRNSAIDISVRADGSPIIQAFGKDGKERISLGLGSSDKPVFVMSDSRWTGRVQLGFLEPDTINPASDTWGLLFHAIGSERTVAGIGMSNGVDGQAVGDVMLDGKRIR
jgi:hypothetical protein